MDPSMEMRSADSARKFNWMCILAKDPDIADLAFELSTLSPQEKKFIVKVARGLIDSTQLYTLAIRREALIERQINDTIIEAEDRFNLHTNGETQYSF